jgi:hypothetical protein
MRDSLAHTLSSGPLKRFFYPTSLRQFPNLVKQLWSLILIRSLWSHILLYNKLQKVPGFDVAEWGFIRVYLVYYYPKSVDIRRFSH